MFLIFQFAHFTFNIDNCKAQWMQTNFTFYGNQYSIQTVTISEKRKRLFEVFYSQDFSKEDSEKLKKRIFKEYISYKNSKIKLVNQYIIDEYSYLI